MRTDFGALASDTVRVKAPAITTSLLSDTTTASRRAHARPSQSEHQAVDILASFPPARGLVFGSTACGGCSREVGVLLAQAASSSAQRQWRSLGARSMLDARSFMISTLRSQVGFAAAVAHARIRVSRLELIGGSGRTAGRYASAARAFISPTAFEQARGAGALGAGAGWRQGRVRWGRPFLSRPLQGAVGSGPAAVESAAVVRPSRGRAGVSLGLDG